MNNSLLFNWTSLFINCMEDNPFEIIWVKDDLFLRGSFCMSVVVVMVAPDFSTHTLNWSSPTTLVAGCLLDVYIFYYNLRAMVMEIVIQHHHYFLSVNKEPGSDSSKSSSSSSQSSPPSDDRGEGGATIGCCVRCTVGCCRCVVVGKDCR